MSKVHGMNYSLKVLLFLNFTRNISDFLTLGTFYTDRIGKDGVEGFQWRQIFSHSVFLIIPHVFLLGYYLGNLALKFLQFSDLVCFVLLRPFSSKISQYKHFSLSSRSTFRKGPQCSKLGSHVKEFSVP